MSLTGTVAHTWLDVHYWCFHAQAKELKREEIPMQLRQAVDKFGQAVDEVLTRNGIDFVPETFISSIELRWPECASNRYD